MSHNVFLMLQECNKFREHQARENLIELLEEQLRARKTAIGELREQIDKANTLLDGGGDDDDADAVVPGGGVDKDDGSGEKTEEGGVVPMETD